MTMPANKIIRTYCKGKMVSRAGFYLGRGNNVGDLNSSLLEMIYSGVKAECGDDAAQSFVQMVAAMTKDASATTFLVSLYRLEQAGWKFDPSQNPKNPAEAFAEAAQDEARKDPGVARVASMMGILSIMSHGDRPGVAASWITRDFLKNHLDADHGKANRPKKNPADIVGDNLDNN